MIIRLIALAILFFATIYKIHAQCPSVADMQAGGTYGGGSCATIDNNGSLTISEDLTWTGGTIEIRDLDDIGAGGFVIPSGMVVTIQAGTITLNDNRGSIFTRNGSIITIESGGQLIIESGASLILESDINVEGTLDVYGTLTNTNADPLDLDISGDLEADGGTVTIYTGADVNIANDVRAINGGSIIVQNGSTLDIGDDLVNNQILAGSTAGTISIEGTVTVGDDVDIADTDPDSSISGTGTITTGGDFIYDEPGGNFTGCGGGSTCGGADTPLPVELVSFQAEQQNGSIQLSWLTATELTNEGFYVERSFNGRDFESIGFVAGNGTTGAPQSYTFVDLEISENRYYRLLQIDFDGAFEYHSVIFVEVNGASDLELYPNPVVDRFRISGNQSEVYAIQVFDRMGRAIYKSAKKDLASVQSDLNSIIHTFDSNETYFLRITSGGSTKEIKFIKQ